MIITVIYKAVKIYYNLPILLFASLIMSSDLNNQPQRIDDAHEANIKQEHASQAQMKQEDISSKGSKRQLKGNQVKVDQNLPAPNGKASVKVEVEEEKVHRKAH